MKNAGYMISGTGRVSLFLNGQSYTIETDHRKYTEIINFLKESNYKAIVRILEIGKTITLNSNGLVELRYGEMYYKGTPVHNGLTKRILYVVENNLPFKPLVNFFTNIMENDLESARNETFGFLECNDLPITEDGCFLAYKRVRSDFMDMYTGTIDNHVGMKPFMLRSAVDADRNNTCSSGLHFCSFEYLKSYNAGQGVIIILKVNPKDVISIPTDYNNSKGRCNTYEVVGISERPETEEALTAGVYEADKLTPAPAVVDVDMDVEDYDDYDEESTDEMLVEPSKKLHNVRGPDGRFLPKGAKVVTKGGQKRLANGRFA